jgi:hypothetical protein
VGTNREGGGILPAYRLIEIIFKRRAEVNNEGVLPRCFWRLDKYKHHIKERNIANKLLQKYDIIVIVKALGSKSGSNILSLGNKRLVPLIKKEEMKHKKQVFNPSDKKSSPPPRKPFGKKNLWSQL